VLAEGSKHEELLVGQPTGEFEQMGREAPPEAIQHWLTAFAADGCLLQIALPVTSITARSGSTASGAHDVGH
jgi:hypothetical protein